MTAGALWDVFARYPYLPRLRDREVLLDSVRRGPPLLTWQTEAFGVADAFDEGAGRYLGLVAGGIPDAVTGATLLVRPELAGVQQADDEGTAREPRTPSADEPALSGSTVTALGVAGVGSAYSTAGVGEVVGGEPPAAGPRRFYGVVALDAERLMRDFDKVVKEVVSHLVGLVDAKVEVTVEVRATSAGGFPEGTVRTVSENAAVLHFEAHSFEEQ